MDKLDMFQYWFGKVDKFGLWYLEWIQTDAGKQFTSKEFQECILVQRLLLKLSAPGYQ